MEGAGAMWRSFRELLEVAGSALVTFAAFENWLDGQGL